MPNLSKEQWQIYSEHLGRALELSESERASWLAELACAHAEIAAEIERALAASDREGYAEFLSSPPIPAPMTGATLVGRRVGPYLIESEIGRGGMGSVWRARRVDGRFEGTVAVKFVHAYWLGRSGEARFRSEGRILGRLDHPNIARLIDAGVIEDSQPYLVLEYVEGESIDAYCDHLKLGVEARVALFQGVIAAVGHAHSQLIIHRDLKPANVFVTREGIVKLLDFGIAKLLDQEGDEAARTQTIAQALTPRFAAPEQLLGRPVTTATDVYGLGLVLYVLLTGAHPLGDDARSTPELIDAILKEEPTRPSLVESPSNLRRRELEGDLDTILGKALKKSPAERYASVAEFAEDLRRFLADEPISARPDTVPYRVTKFVRRNRGSVLSGVLVAMGLLVTSIFALTQMQAARAQRDRAIEEARHANAEADLTQYILDDKLSRLSPEAEGQRLNRARKFLAARFHDEPVLAARLLLDVSGSYIDIGDFRTAAEVSREAETIGKRFDDANILGQLACVRTEDLALDNDFAGARVQLVQGLAQMRRLNPVPPDFEAECALAEAFVVQAEGNFALAVDHLRTTVADLDRAGMHGAARYLAASNDLARALIIGGRYHEALDVGSRNVALVSEMGRSDTNAYLAYVSGVCSALRNGGQPTRAVAYIDGSTARVRHDPAYADMGAGSESCWALSLLDSGEPQRAEPAILEAASKAEQGGVSFQAALLRASSVNAALARGDLATAESRWAALRPDKERRLSMNEKGAEVVRLLLLSARLDLAEHRSDEALKSLERAAGLIASRHQPTNPDARELESLRSSALMEERRYLEAEQRAQAAIELAKISAVDPESSLWVGEALLQRARAEAAVGRKTASATAQEALHHLTANLDPKHPFIAQARELASSVPR